MPQIRRITEPEAPVVAALWDRMCRDVLDGGPLTPSGLRNISRMLSVSAFHHQTACLVAVEGSTVVGFALTRVDPGDGLLPGLLGELGELYVVPEARGHGISRALASAAVTWLRERDVWTIRKLICADAHREQAFWQAAGFEPDMTCLSLYRDA